MYQEIHGGTGILNVEGNVSISPKLTPRVLTVDQRQHLVTQLKSAKHSPTKITVATTANPTEDQMGFAKQLVSDFSELGWNPILQPNSGFTDLPVTGLVVLSKAETDADGKAVFPFNSPEALLLISLQNFGFEILPTIRLMGGNPDGEMILYILRQREIGLSTESQPTQ